MSFLTKEKLEELGIHYFELDADGNRRWTLACGYTSGVDHEQVIILEESTVFDHLVEKQGDKPFYAMIDIHVPKATYTQIAMFFFRWLLEFYTDNMRLPTMLEFIEVVNEKGEGLEVGL
ncbi:MAG: hypothetical protein ACRCYY_21900 [Trueperaceae bacterium]